MKIDNMVFLIDILHPAHVHFFKEVYQELKKRGHQVLITAREKEISIDLLEAYQMDYILISRQKNGVGLINEMVARTSKLFRICQQTKPVLLLGIMGPSIAVVGSLRHIPTWIFYDTENAWITNFFAYPLSSRVYTPACYIGRNRSNQIRYPGYHELAYLHPNCFQPKQSIVRLSNLDPYKPYFIIRFVGWQASHDAGESGLSLQYKEQLVEILKPYGSVYISSESPLPHSLRAFALQASVTDIHHIMAFARLVIGESATMASEAAVLGVKAVFISDTKRGYTLDQEKRYGLVANFSTNQFKAIRRWIKAELNDKEALVKTRKAHQRLLHEMINVSTYMMDEISREFSV